MGSMQSHIYGLKLTMFYYGSIWLQTELSDKIVVKIPVEIKKITLNLRIHNRSQARVSSKAFYLPLCKELLNDRLYLN